jgi:hypothetical protein
MLRLMQTKGNCQVTTLAYSAARPRPLSRESNRQMAPDKRKEAAPGINVGFVRRHSNRRPGYCPYWCSTVSAAGSQACWTSTMRMLRNSGRRSGANSSDVNGLYGDGFEMNRATRMS